MLDHVFTDISIDHGISRLLKKLPQSLHSQSVHKIMGRSVSGVPLRKITAFELMGYRYYQKLRSARSEDDRLKSYMWVEKQFSKQILKYGTGEARSIYAFNGAAIGLFEHAHSKGIDRVLEQTIAPKRVENEILAQALSVNGETTRFDRSLMADFILQEETEWQLADKILCASEFVKDGLIHCGVHPEKCIVVPYGVTLKNFDVQKKKDSLENKKRTVNVLFVGAVGVRKGIWTLLKAMSLLKGVDVKCRIVGPVTDDVGKLLKACPPNTEIVGPLPRSLIPEEFRKADIFCLPSLCEGSATVIYEALASGVPVVTTHNAGSIVRDGLDGFIIPHSDENALAEAIRNLADDQDYRIHAGRNALTRSRLGSMEAYSKRLRAALEGS